MNVSIKISSSVENNQRAVFWNDQLSHHIREAELQDALQEARRGFWKTNATRGAELGGRVFDLLNGSGSQLETALNESYQTGAPLHLALDIPFELDALPFELLYWESPSPAPSHQADRGR